MFTVARHLFVDQRRRALLDFDRIRDLRLWPSRPRRYEPTPFDLSEASETARRVETALQSLPGPYREIVLLCAVEGLTPTQAARVVGGSSDAVRQRLARGRRMLRDALEKP